jgi:hypothetical protein
MCGVSPKLITKPVLTSILSPYIPGCIQKQTIQKYQASSAPLPVVEEIHLVLQAMEDWPPVVELSCRLNSNLNNHP